MPRPGKLLRRLAVVPLLALPGHATWSIVAVDTHTGEVSIAAATCIEDFDLQRWLPVMRVGEGGGVAQGLIDISGADRLLIWNGFLAGEDPAEILHEITIKPSVNARQFGVSGLHGDPVAWSGQNLDEAKLDVQGQIGPILYTIQGNILAGDAVVFGAEEALLTTDGDLSQRVMAAMEAARALGGDGRCSCPGAPPCDPPPGAKSAHVAFIVHSRVGDVNGTCGSAGCATGTYWLELQVSGDDSDPDPVIELQAAYDAWRAGLAGHPDGVQSTVTASASALVADGTTAALVTVRLHDVEGAPLAGGGAVLAVSHVGPGAPPATVGPVTDHGDGSYSFALTAGTAPGVGVWRVTADDGAVLATLQPDLVVAVDPLVPLHAGAATFSAGEGAELPLVVNLGAGAAGSAYLVAAGTSGTDPGVDLGPATLPLNLDDFTWAALAAAGGPQFPGAFGVLDGAGRAEATFAPGPGVLAALVGLEIHFAAVELMPPLGATNAVGVLVLP